MVVYFSMTQIVAYSTVSDSSNTKVTNLDRKKLKVCASGQCVKS